jgi:hypothetical protein
MARRGVDVDKNRVQGGTMDNRSESGRDVDEGTLDQMAVESVDREACLEGCSVVTLQTGVHVMDKEWARRKRCGRQQAARRLV